VLPSRPHVPGYDRECGSGHACTFGPAWADTDHNGCDQRNDVLRAQLVDVTIKPGTNGCVVASGKLHDPYTGQTIDFVRGPQSDRVQIDHVVPLALAYDLGAAAWPPARRQAFANDTSLELLAVDGQANESKGEDGPAHWMPPNAAYACSYVARFVAVLDRYGLPILAEDQTRVQQTLRSCPR
jgi:Protein of unknown function (DUF1524)